VAQGANPYSGNEMLEKMEIAHLRDAPLITFLRREKAGCPGFRAHLDPEVLLLDEPPRRLIQK